ncbi:MAG: pneumococcal-type histidine triad protein [Streptococcus sp.]
MCHAPPSSQLTSSVNPNQPISDPVTPTITASASPNSTNKGGTLQTFRKSYKTPLSERHVESDGSVLIQVRLPNGQIKGVVYPHGDHFHFIPYSLLSP